MLRRVLANATSARRTVLARSGFSRSGGVIHNAGVESGGGGPDADIMTSPPIRGDSMDEYDVAEAAERTIGFREMLRDTVILAQLERGDRAGVRPAWASVEEWAEVTEMAQEAEARFYE